MFPSDEVKVANIVVSFVLNSKLNRDDLRAIYPYIRYLKKFSGGIIKFTGGCLLIFESGKINVTGITHEYQAFDLDKLFISKLPTSPDIKSYFVVSMTASFSIKNENIFERLKYLPRSSYEPELFPGIHMKLVKSKITFIVFRSGKVIITEAKSLETLSRYHGYFIEITKENH